MMWVSWTDRSLSQRAIDVWDTLGLANITATAVGAVADKVAEQQSQARLKRRVVMPWLPLRAL
jgi:hypothetical protein